MATDLENLKGGMRLMEERKLSLSEWVWAIIMVLLLIAISAMATYGLIKLFNQIPEFTSNASGSTKVNVAFFSSILNVNLSLDGFVVMIALLAGALGGCVHGIRSVVRHLGVRRFESSWVPWYICRPVLGAALAFVFYVVVRGGFLTMSTNGSDINPYGFAAVALLVGIFSEGAILKLKELADNIFTDPKKADPATDEE